MSGIIRETLAEEFRRLEFPEPAELATSEAIVVLCAEEVEVVGENKERIEAGLALAQDISSKTLIFMGTKWHNDKLKQYLATRSTGVTVLYPTNRTQDSSRTQIKCLPHFLKEHSLQDVVILSHAYHIPRIKRYCQKYLFGINTIFYPIGNLQDQREQVKNEIEKIIKYAEQGDLPLELI